MRVLSILLWIATLGFLLFWAFAYIYIHGLACAFGNPNSTTCSIDMPWQLGGEDFMLLIAVPSAVFLFLLALAVFTGRVAKRRAL